LPEDLTAKAGQNNGSLMSRQTGQVDLANQHKLIDALLHRHCPGQSAQPVRLVETHISWVLLAGRYAYKIKKALNLGFLDFTSLAQRKLYCDEEIRLNSRLAPAIYLDVIAFGGDPDKPEYGALPALEYAVRMRRFPAKKQLDYLLVQRKIEPQHMDKLAVLMADFHATLPHAEVNSRFGKPATIRAAARQNFDQLQSLLSAPAALTAQADLDTVAELRLSTEKSYAAGQQYFKLRRTRGFIRECHGDLHPGNIVLIGDQPVPFDGIEFNPALRWIDVIDEISFLMMDLCYRQRQDLAFCFLNAYLEQTGDYSGVAVLRFYLAYRAVVRAKVSAIRAFQPGHGKLKQTQLLSSCRNYLKLAGECLVTARPALIITHGLPGCGKSTFARIAAQRLQAIGIRSDVERKRLFGIGQRQPSGSLAGKGIYSTDASNSTYSRLLELAQALLTAGHPVIVDAAFLRQDQREQFHALALSFSVPFVIVSIAVSAATLLERISLRQNQANDASEADHKVLQLLQAQQQPLLSHELEQSVIFVNDANEEGRFTDVVGWNKLDELLSLSATKFSD
jgi:aminoglycoside phosphotransferase family enzyme/predicted kinase